MEITKKQQQDITRWIQSWVAGQAEPYVFKTKFKCGMTAETYSALRAADRPPREGTKPGKSYDERRAINYMTWLLKDDVYRVEWEGNRIRYAFAGHGQKHEIPNWNA